MFVRQKLTFFKLTVYGKHRGDISNISILHLIRRFDDSGVNKISTVCFRHLFTPIILYCILVREEHVWSFISPEKIIFPKGNAPGKYGFSKGSKSSGLPKIHAINCLLYRLTCDTLEYIGFLTNFSRKAIT